MTNGSLMKAESIAECSPWSILQYFWPALSHNWSWKPIFCLFGSGFTVQSNMSYCLHVGSFLHFFCCFYVLFFRNESFQNILSGIWSVPNSLNQGWAGHFIWPDLGSKAVGWWQNTPIEITGLPNNKIKSNISFARYVIFACFFVGSIFISLFRDHWSSPTTKYNKKLFWYVVLHALSSADFLKFNL